jgi:hypothetical protein
MTAGSQRPPELRELELFARDPVRQVHRIRAKKEIRQTLHQTIERLGLDMTHVTERKGSPYTLVLTKTRASYERACKRAEKAALRKRFPRISLPMVEREDFLPTAPPQDFSEGDWRENVPEAGPIDREKTMEQLGY